MLSISIPPDFFEERAYVINILFKEFLNVEYTLSTNENNVHYKITTVNGGAIFFEDHFFSKHKPEPLAYLLSSNIPENASAARNNFTLEKDIPVLYGRTETVYDENKNTISCGLDIFASCFFMLTRWEEYAVKNRDVHDRFLASYSWAFKSGFLHRPIVNEYVEMLWNMLLKIGFEGKRQPSRFQIVPTHDVDTIFFPFDIVTALGDVLRMKKISGPFKRYYYYFKRCNPYDTFKWLMDISEQNNCISRFYFMSNGKSGIDNTYKLDCKEITALVAEIKLRQHIIGFHPGYDTYTNHTEWKRQKQYLENTLSVHIDEGRQHYLKFKTPETAQIWHDNNMKIDSSLGYSDSVGFRCGTGNEFSMFNFLTRKQLSVKERPLILMDVTLRPYSNYASQLQQAPQIFEYYKQACKKYGMPFTILFHNSSFDDIRWPGWKRTYEKFFAESLV